MRWPCWTVTTLVLSVDAIHSRDNCFLYLKEIVKGESYIMLSDEEVEALKNAVNDIDEDIM